MDSTLLLKQSWVSIGHTLSPNGRRTHGQEYSTLDPSQVLHKSGVAPCTLQAKVPKSWLAGAMDSTLLLKQSWVSIGHTLSPNGRHTHGQEYSTLDPNQVPHKSGVAPCTLQ